MAKKQANALKNIHFCIIMTMTLIGTVIESQNLKRSLENSKKKGGLSMFVRHAAGFFFRLLRKNADSATKV